jgi:RecA-family ATPase
VEAAEADLSLIFGLEGVVDPRHPEGRLLSLPTDTRIVHRAILNTEAKLVVIDPFFSYLDPEINTGIDAEVRHAMMPLTRVAQETECAIVLVRHLRKPDARAKSTSPSLFDGGGSLGGIIGAARSGLAAVTDEDNPTYSTLFQTKSNWGAWVRPIDYQIEGLTRQSVGRIRWQPR